MNVSDPLELIALGLFSEDAAVRKKARAALVAHPDPKLAAHFASDKRNVHSLTDAAKFTKLVAEYEGLGLDGFALCLAVLRAQKPTAQRIHRGLQSEAALAATCSIAWRLGSIACTMLAG